MSLYSTTKSSYTINKNEQLKLPKLQLNNQISTYCNNKSYFEQITYWLLIFFKLLAINIDWTDTKNGC